MQPMKKRVASLALAIAVLLAASLLMTGCTAPKDAYTPVSGLDLQRPVSLKIAIPYETSKALNTVSNAFMAKYPNVSVHLEYIEDYDTNAVQLFKGNSLDIILQKDIVYEEYTVKDAQTGEQVPTGATPDDYFYNFAADQEIDFSATTPDIAANYLHTRVDADGGELAYQYSYPLGGEMRGFFVNVSFLDSLGLPVPTNYAELLQCCEAVQRAGYTPIQGHIATMAYGLGIAQAANTVVHDADALRRMAAAEEGVSRCFEDTFQKIYELCIRRYCDYKAIEATGCFADSSELGQARSFLGLSYDNQTFESVKPENNIGYTAFFPYISSSQTVIEELIQDYDLDTKFRFICSPLNDEGTHSPIYITPFYGVCANKHSENLVWIREFVNFLFQEQNLKTYAENAAVIPNTKDALQYVAQKYGLNVDTDITLCGQINFSPEYNGFKPLANGIMSVSKCNAPKYMVNLNRDAGGNPQYETGEDGLPFLYLGNGTTVIRPEYVAQEDPATPGYAFCTLAYYLDVLEGEFANCRVK